MCHLLRTIERKMIGEIDKDSGYIISANQILNIVHNENTTFVLEIEVKTYKPKIKQKIDGLVCGIFKAGIFVHVFEKAENFNLPKIYIKDYAFDENNNKYENNNNRIGMGDKIKVEIKAVTFDEC